MASLSIQWGNYLLPMLVIWALGSVIIWRLRRFHITGIYVASFIAFAFLRSWMTGSPWQSEIAPHHRADVSAIYFLHDHRSQDDGAIRSEGNAWSCFWWRLLEMVMRLYQIVYAPFYALFMVGPTAMLIEIWLDSRRAHAGKKLTVAQLMIVKDTLCI